MMMMDDQLFLAEQSLSLFSATIIASNCCDQRTCIQKVYEEEGFGRAYAIQKGLPLDSKGNFPVVHFINILLEQCNQKSSQYYDCSLAVHSAFCDKANIYFKNAEKECIPNRLFPSKTILDNIHKLITRFKINEDQRAGNEDHVVLLKAEFERTYFENTSTCILAAFLIAHRMKLPCMIVRNLIFGM